jgi:PHP family Zn ribbon phosphoesterase
MQGVQIYINVRFYAKLRKEKAAETTIVFFFFLFQIRVERIVHVVILLPSCNKLQNFSAITSAWKGTRLTRMHV